MSDGSTKPFLPFPTGCCPTTRKGIAAWQQKDPDAHGVWNKASKKAAAAKRKVPVFIAAGTFRPGHRHGEMPPRTHLQHFPDCPTGLLEQSGVIMVDLDPVMAHGTDQESLMRRFEGHPSVIGAFVSPSNDRIKVIMAVDPVPWNDESHVRAWASAREELASIYAYIDQSGKDVARLCYQSELSSDSGCYIASDDKVITPARMADPEPMPELEQSPGAKSRGRPRRAPHLDEVQAAQGVGADAHRIRAKKEETSKDATTLVNALKKLGLAIRFNSRALKSEVRPMTEGGKGIVEEWGEAAQTQPNGWTILKPAQAANLRARIARNVNYIAGNGQTYFLKFSKEQWREANLDLSATGYADPFQEWQENLPAWDDQDRWAQIFTDGYGVVPGEDHTVEYLAHAGRLLVIPCVGRLYEPGAEASTMTVLIGKEGIGKSLGLKCLFPYEWRQWWFSDSISLKISDKELLEKVSGFILLEVAELSGMMRQDQERVKSLISSCQDVARLAFREDSEAFPRRFHLCGSANDEGHGVLPDSSENRRFWPVNIPPHCNRGRVLQWFEANHVQLWAQALVEWQSKGIEAWINPAILEPERLDAAAAQRRSARGAADLANAIEALDRKMLANGHTIAELLWKVNAFGNGRGGDGSDPMSLAEVAAKTSAGPGASISNAVTRELKRRGWIHAMGNSKRGRGVRGSNFWWPPTHGTSNNVVMS